ncbi:CLUMA_CG007720, isoform A [Clunio marinus]|uniref:CLUMA_CG007720, isoform A n=1 Tax=Clunio marinus TaxID=568069 RepID=A0A1J1I3N0_9DIPT|nr:CLUMA_CG007720, isoform A [Clunio marinus]
MKEFMKLTTSQGWIGILRVRSLTCCCQNIKLLKESIAFNNFCNTHTDHRSQLDGDEHLKDKIFHPSHCTLHHILYFALSMTLMLIDHVTFTQPST